MRLSLWLSLALVGACSLDVEAPSADGDAGLTVDSGSVGAPDAQTNDAGSLNSRDATALADSGLAPVEDSGVGRDTGADRPDTGPVQPEDDHGNDLDSATRLNEQRRAAGRIESPGDVDFFVFRTTSRGIYTIYTTGETDTFCTLYDNEGQTLSSSNDAGEGQNCRIEQTLSGDALYFVRVRHHRDGTGGYNLVIEGPREVCGDGVVTAGEGCDDGNTRNGDGCDSECREEVVPEGCENVDGRDRLTIVCHGNPLIWPEAKTACEDWNGNLVTILDRRDHERFPAFVRRRGSLWIGLNDLEREGRYTWVGRNSNYRNWGRGEPNNWGGDEDCIMLRREADSGWNDQGCNAELGYICER